MRDAPAPHPGLLSLACPRESSQKEGHPGWRDFSLRVLLREKPGAHLHVRPFAGTTVHRTVVFIRLTPAHPRFRGPGAVLTGHPAWKIGGGLPARAPSGGRARNLAVRGRAIRGPKKTTH